MNRRDMLKETAVAMLVSQLPAIGAPGTADRTPALDPLPDYLEGYKLPKGNPSDPTRTQTLTFDIVEWRVGTKRLKVTNAVIGSLVIKRTPETGRIIYQTERKIHKVDTVTGEFVCTNDRWHSLREWRLQHVLHRAGNARRIKLLSTRQAGKANGTGYELTRDGGTRKADLDVPLTCQGGLIDRLPSLDLAVKPRFALVEGASGVRPNQQLQVQGKHTVAGQTTRSILQTGHATIPTHWIIDDQNRPLFITTFLLSLALVEIS